MITVGLSVFHCPWDPIHPSSINNPDNISVRAEAIGRVDGLDEAIVLLRESFDNHPGYPDRFNSFASSGLARFEQMGKIDNLEEAITFQLPPRIS